MEIFFVTLGVLMVCIFGMAIGVILSNRELKGSCGGLGKVIGEDCMFCEKKEDCKENPEQAKDCLDLEKEGCQTH
ncbi:(Na+)-NQR maturation NqrM [Bacteriovorax sp. Seq25_V]|uniref:(Na+)-NQR maturation NqrM n=1 Tax=Bacteriovorax sp. Seq25_V TaxID=1201288 RepID=UPI00038A059B|nr:(Na+)-NQR maturation NqrM [Bacteriovorax sp. Seq25_V]EQC46000.1 PF04400 family protein [Bacteriovorax sp. Seq25_V]